MQKTAKEGFNCYVNNGLGNGEKNTIVETFSV